jgi:energy-coupling factor transporter ATP-binding protein EcfA2
MNPDHPIARAMSLPSGARFRRCVLRLRPAGPATALVEACRRHGVEVVAVDGGDAEAVATFERQAREAGLAVVRRPAAGDGVEATVGATVAAPADLDAPDAWCWVKMSEPSDEALRQAFLDPGSRIRRQGDPEPERRVELVAMAWQSGGFLGELAIHLNAHLNVLVGGRGTGKSTILESLRYVLEREPLGDEARRTHDGIVKSVLRSGTKISLLVRSRHPAEREYVVERTLPNPPLVRSREGEILDLTPADVVPRIEIYGQHEIAELVRSPQKLTRLFERFTARDAAAAERRGELGRELERTRREILDGERELAGIGDRLAALPALEETLRRFQEAGLEEKLRDRSLLVREEQILRTADARLAPLRRALEALRRELPVDRAFLVAGAGEPLPGHEILAAADPVLAALDGRASALAGELAAALAEAEHGLQRVRGRWEGRRSAVQEAYEATLRELQAAQVDGEEFIRLRQQIEQLRPLKEREAALRQVLAARQGERQRLLAEWEDAKAASFRELGRAAERVNGELAGRVRVRLEHAGHREPLFELLRERVGGRLSEAIEALRRREILSLEELVAACRSGREALIERFEIPPAQAERLCQASLATLMEIEELDLEPTTGIELNVGGWSEAELPAVWQPLDQLSTGQKATAVLLLLLLESDAPLVVDQPEDDLDNRFIAEAVVPKIRAEKRRRQLVFATHNANIPVIGDAELILGLAASGEAGRGRARIAPEHMGSIDARPIRELVEEVLEGGRNAFETRRRKYGF